MTLLTLVLAAGNAEAKKYKPAPRTAKNIVIAHRGYWNTPGAFENSIAALDNAMNFGIYGASSTSTSRPTTRSWWFTARSTPWPRRSLIQKSGYDVVLQHAAGQRRTGAHAAASICLRVRAIRRRN